MEVGKKKKVVLEIFTRRLGFFQYTLKQSKVMALIIGSIGFIISIADFTIVSLSISWRIYLSLLTIGATAIAVLLFLGVKTIVNSKKARELLINYLKNLREIRKQYCEKIGNFNLIERNLKVGEIRSSDEKISEQKNWQFRKEEALPWIAKEIAENKHVFIKGEMGIGKSVLMLSIANHLADKAIEMIEEKKYSEMVIPLYVPLGRSEFFSQSLFEGKKNFKVTNGTELLQADRRLEWITHVLTIDQRKEKEMVSKEEKELLFDYLKYTLQERKETAFILLYDAFDEFPFKKYTGNLSPRMLFGLHSQSEPSDYWNGPVVISCRPYILDELETKIKKSKELDYQVETKTPKDDNYSYAELKEFTDKEVEEYIKNRPIYKNNEQYQIWDNFRKKVIEAIWKKNYDNEWRIPLFLWVLSSKKSIEEMPETKRGLFLEIFKYTFNWFYCKIDNEFKKKPEEEWEEYCDRKGQKQTIIINDQKISDSTFTISPASLFHWEKEMLKELALFLSENNRQNFTISEYEKTLKRMKRNPKISSDERKTFEKILLQTMEDGSFIICPSYDEQGMPRYSFSPQRMQEAFTAMKFSELNKIQRIDLLKALLPLIEEKRETIKLCWYMRKEKSKNEEQLKEELIDACPDFRYLFHMNEITPLELLTSIDLIAVIDGQIRIHAINFANSHFLNVNQLLHLTQLQVLFLRSSRLSQLPSLDKLTQLQVLFLRSSRLSQLPSLDKLTQLQELYLSSSRLSQLPSLDKLTQLQGLYLSSNKLTELPSLDKLTQLQRLDLSSNKLTELPSLDKLTQLQRLDLWENQITSMDISPIVFHTQLKEISIDDDVQLFCKRELMNKIVCPALLRMKNRIQPID